MRTVRAAFIATLIVARSMAYAELDFGFAKEDGGHAGVFLESAGSARALSMGSASVGVSDDASAVLTNPAGLAQIQRNDIVVSYTSLFENSSLGILNYAQPTVDWGTMGVGLVTLQSSDFDRRDDNGASSGNFGSSELGILLSHGFDVNDRLSLGSGVKIIRQEIDSFSGTGYGVDGAAQLRVSPMLQLGLVLRNLLAPRIKLRNETDKYPFDIRIGAKWQALRKLMIAMDLNKTSDRSLKLHVGGEWVFNNLLSLRAGLTETEVTTGLGFKFKDWGVDYAFGFNDAAAGIGDLGAFHRFGLHMNFGKKVFEQEASVRWQKKGQLHLAELRTKMDESYEPVFDEELQKIISGTRQVIRRQGYLKASDLYAAQGYVSYFMGEFDRSVQSLGESSVLDPDNSQLAQHLEKARAQLTEERTREIVELELKWVKQAYDKADWRGAVKSCEKILSFIPDHIEATMYLEDARKRISEPIERELKIAIAKFDRGEYLDAIKSLQRVKELDPENKEADHYITQSIAALENQAAAAPEAVETPARDVFEVKRNSEQSRVLYSQGLLLYSQGKVEEAAQVWERATQFDPENVSARNAFNRAQVELREKQ